MNKVILGLSTLEEAGNRFIAAWKKAEQNQATAIDCESIYFTDFSTLLNVLSKKRLELLHELQTQPGISIYELAKRLQRHYKNVHTDVTKLKEIGLITEDKGLRVPFTKIVAEIGLAA